jgi:hypothetical protein
MFDVFEQRLDNIEGYTSTSSTMAFDTRKLNGQLMSKSYDQIMKGNALDAYFYGELVKALQPLPTKLTRTHAHPHRTYTFCTGCKVGRLHG